MYYRFYLKDLKDRSEGFAFTGYDIPGCMEDGAWMLWENSSVVVAAVAAAAAVAHLGLGGEVGEWGICPYGIRYPWVRGGWGLDALGKFFRRRCRRRPPRFGKRAVIGFYYDSGASGVRGSIRLVFRVPLERELRKVVVGKLETSKRSRTKH